MFGYGLSRVARLSVCLWAISSSLQAFSLSAFQFFKISVTPSPSCASSRPCSTLPWPVKCGACFTGPHQSLRLRRSLVGFHLSIAEAFRFLDRMPEISRFLGVVISMYFDEHNPPHFHVRYNESRAIVSISSKCRPPARMAARGSLPKAARRATRAGRGRQLLQMWESKQFHKIEPLA